MMTRRHSLPAVVLATLVLMACSADKPGNTGNEISAGQAEAEVSGIPWFQGSVEDAFARAKAEEKPLFFYWGAQWCP